MSDAAAVPALVRQTPAAERTHLRAAQKWGGRILLFAILFAPSVWMLAKLPPLWRDADAYVQVTAPASIVTILHYAPLYCFAARIPLYLGFAFDSLRAGSSLPPLHFFAEPTLSDSGVWLLLFLQHLAICLSSCLVIAASTRRLVVRAALALVWATNPLFYSFAHCVGSETLSCIFLLLLGAAGIVIVRCGRRVSIRLWFAAGALISLAMLTRHVNGVTAALLPLAFGFAGATRWLAARLRKPDRWRRWLMQKARQDLRRALLAIGVGVVAIVAAHLTLRLVSYSAGIHYHSRLGYTFLFRMDYLGPLSAAERAPLLERAATHSRTPHVQGVLEALRDAPSGAEEFDPMAVIRRWKAQQPADADISDEQEDEIFNETARAFLVAPTAPYLRAIARDCLRAADTSLLDVVRQLVQSTSWYFRDPSQMPKLAGLETFRDPRSVEVLENLRKEGYFKRWRHFTTTDSLALWLGLFTVAALQTRCRNAALFGYALALIVVGLLVVIATNILDRYQVRFSLPAWQFTIVAVTLLVAMIAESLRRQAGVRLI
ncbi:MAG: hypothetical protein M3Y86_00365, partial [Verrucomicrobiota bacterium]|nr:hypothetical protein [Verrucomicrobiota bacterium]